jgi:hypothetical protein
MLFVIFLAKDYPAVDFEVGIELGQTFYPKQ